MKKRLGNRHRLSCRFPRPGAGAAPVWGDGLGFGGNLWESGFMIATVEIDLVQDTRGEGSSKLARPPQSRRAPSGGSS